MSDLSLIPLQDGFETQLSQDWDGNTGTVYVLATPSYTPTTTNTYIVVNPGKTNMQIAEITSYDSTAKTLTVSSISFEKGLGISSTAQDHSTGSKVIISDNYQFWVDIQTAINTKLDDTGGTMTGLLQFTGTTHAGIKLLSLTTAQRDALSASNGMLIYNSTTGELNQYIGGAWSAVAAGSTQPTASTTVLGKIKTDVTPAGDPVALITDNPKYDALAGTSGTPSTSNKYVTADDVAENTASKAVRRKSDSNITVPTTPTASTDASSKSYADGLISALELGTPEQDIPYVTSNIANNIDEFKFSTNVSGSVGAAVFKNAAATEATVLRFAKDTLTGQYIITNVVTLTAGVDRLGVCLTTNYVYVSYSESGTYKMRRYDIANLANSTAITVSGSTWTNGESTFSDGTDIYIFNSATSGNAEFRKYTISGTVATHSTNITYNSATSGTTVVGGATCDGTNVWIANTTGLPSVVINKFALAGGAATGTATRYIYSTSYDGAGEVQLSIAKSGALGVGFAHRIYDETAQVGGAFKLMSITQP